MSRVKCCLLDSNFSRLYHNFDWMDSDEISDPEDFYILLHIRSNNSLTSNNTNNKLTTLGMMANNNLCLISSM